MKKHIRLLTLAAISLAGFTYGNQLQASSPDNAIFSHFTYTGQDKVSLIPQHYYKIFFLST